MGYALGICLFLLLRQAAFAERDVHLDVESYNSSVVDLSCTYKGAKSFSVYKDGRKCIEYDSDCSYYNEDYCKFSCMESAQPNVVLFQVKLSGSCQEQMTIRCGPVIQNDQYVLTAQSDSPVISINNGKPVETSSPAVPVLIVCTITNKCSNKTNIEITGPSGVRLSPVVFNHTQHGDRFTTTALTNGTFFEAGKYTITCKEKGKDGQFANNLTIEVHEPNSGLMKEEQKQNGKGLSDGTLAAVILVLVALFCIAIFVGWYMYCWRRRQRSPNRVPEAVELLQGMSPGSSSYPPEAPTRKTPELLQLKDAICGIWDKEDDQNGEKILQAIKSNNQKEVERAMIDDGGSYLKQVQEGRNYAGYFALISSHSLENQEFMAYLTSVIVRSSIVHLSTLVLVLLEKDILSSDLWNNSVMNDLGEQTTLHVDASGGLDKDKLRQICNRLKGRALQLTGLDGYGDVGVVLAWNYYLGYLKFVLEGNSISESPAPEMKERIKEWQKKHPGRMCPFFIIIIPLTDLSRIPATLNEADKRFAEFGDLDAGVKMSRAGRKNRSFKSKVQKIVKSKDDFYYFCGEYAEVSFLNKIIEPNKFTISDAGRQLNQFIEALQAILSRHPKSGQNAVLYTSTQCITMVDELCARITNPKESQSEPSGKYSPMKVSRLAEGLALSYYHNNLKKIGPTIANRIKNSKCYRNASGRMPTKFFILLPHSCKCPKSMTEADENIIFHDKLEKADVQMAGNTRNFGCAIHKISIAGETYYACVEYCTRFATMYEMTEKEDRDLSGLSPVQIAAEARVFYEILYDLLYVTRAEVFSSSIELIYFNDGKGGEKVSNILVKKIKESLKEE